MRAARLFSHAAAGKERRFAAGKPRLLRLGRAAVSARDAGVDRAGVCVWSADREAPGQAGGEQALALDRAVNARPRRGAPAGTFPALPKARSRLAWAHPPRSASAVSSRHWSGELTLALVQDADARPRRWFCWDLSGLAEAQEAGLASPATDRRLCRGPVGFFLAANGPSRAREVASRLLPGRH